MSTAKSLIIGSFVLVGGQSTLPGPIVPHQHLELLRDQERIAALERKLQAKNEVLAELMEEHVALKKVLGKADRPLGAP